MDKTSLFNFEFVDRFRERKIFKNYFNSNDYEHTLWITGKRGVGKTTFIKQMFLEISTYQMIWIDNSIQSDNSNEIKLLLNQLQRLSGEKIYDFVLENYSLLWETGKEVANEYLKDKNKFLAKISDLLFDSSTHFIDGKYNDKEKLYKLINLYLDKISKRMPLFIVLDNYSRYNDDVVQFFLNLIRTFIKSDRIKFCIITTDEDLERKESLETTLYRNIPTENINIKNFDSAIYFAEILKKCFSRTKFNFSEIEYINQKCQGNPENLLKMIKKGVKRNIIQWSFNTAVIDKPQFFAILRTETNSFTLKDFSFPEQLMLLVMLCIGRHVNAEFLKLVIDYLANKIFLYQQFTDNIFFETLGELISDQILKYEYNNELVFDHDSIYIDINDILYDLKLKPQICMNLYELVISIQLEDYGFTKENIMYYKAYYAYEAQITGWEHINFHYGEILCDNHLYSSASKIFDRLPLGKYIKDSEKVMVLTKAYFEDGRYQQVYNILANISIDSNTNLDLKQNYFFLLGKAENIIGKKQDAIKHFKAILPLNKNNFDKYVEILNLIHLTYMEVYDGKKKAKVIFEYMYTVNHKYHRIF